MTEPLIFRPADPSDLEPVFAIVQRAARHMDSQGIHQWDDLYPAREDLAEDIARRQLWVGTAEGQIVLLYALNRDCDPAYASGQWQHPEESWYVLHRLCVDPAVQGQGLARQAVEHMEGQVRSLGGGAVRLDVFSRNPHALRLYTGLGYTPVGTVRWRMGDFILMEKNLVR